MEQHTRHGETHLCSSFEKSARYRGELPELLWLVTDLERAPMKRVEVAFRFMERKNIFFGIMFRFLVMSIQCSTKYSGKFNIALSSIRDLPIKSSISAFYSNHNDNLMQIFNLDYPSLWWPSLRTCLNYPCLDDEQLYWISCNVDNVTVSVGLIFVRLRPVFGSWGSDSFVPWVVRRNFVLHNRIISLKSLDYCKINWWTECYIVVGNYHEDKGNIY